MASIISSSWLGVRELAGKGEHREVGLRMG